MTSGQSNVLVDATGQARIMGFCLEMATKGVNSEQSTSDKQILGGQWSAPEIFNEGKCSKEADIFSLAMVMIEVRHG